MRRIALGVLAMGCVLLAGCATNEVPEVTSRASAPDVAEVTPEPVRVAEVTGEDLVLTAQKVLVAAGTEEDPVQIAHAAAAIKVDGDLAEWRGVTPMPAPFQKLAASCFRMAWREDGLYGAVDAVDEDIQASPEFPWTADSVEVWIEKDAAHAFDRTDETTQYTFSPDPDSKDGKCTMLVPYGLYEEMDADSGITASWRKTAKGYGLEFFIPARLLQPAEMAAGTKMSLNFALNDDGVAKEQFFCDKDVDEGYRAPELWGTVQLAK